MLLHVSYAVITSVNELHAANHSSFVNEYQEAVIDN